MMKFWESNPYFEDPLSPNKVRNTYRVKSRIGRTFETKVFICWNRNNRIRFWFTQILYLTYNVWYIGHIIKLVNDHQIKGSTFMAEYEFHQIMKFLTNYMKSLNMYNAIFCNSGKYISQLINEHSFFQQHIVSSWTNVWCLIIIRNQ